MNKEKVAIIVWPNAFKFGWMGSTKRFLVVKKALNNLGYEVVILAQNYSNKSVQVDMENQLNLSVIRTKIKEGGFKSTIHKMFVSFYSRLLKKNEKYEYRVSAGWAETVDWVNLIEKQQLKNVDIVWSMSGGLLDSIIAGNTIAEILDTKHIAEFHDPIIGADILGKNPLVLEEFKKQLERKPKLIPNTQSYCKTLLNEYDIANNDVTVMYMTHSGTCSPVKARKTADVIKICYAGSLSGERDLQKFVLALSNSDLGKRRIQLDLAGVGDGFEKLIQVTKNLDNINVKYWGRINAKSADELAKTSDINILIQPQVNNLEIPGKLFTLLSFCKPVIGILDPYSETATILQNSGLGVIVDISNQPEAIVLPKISDLEANLSFINKFSERSFTSQIEEILE